MKKLWRWLIPLLLLVVVTADVATAGTVRSPSKDTTCELAVNGQCADGFGVTFESSAIENSSVCTVVYPAFIGWDLSGVTTTIENAQLTMTTYNVLGPEVGVPVQIQLFQPSNHTWAENGATSPGGSGTTLATTSVVLTEGTTPQTVIFGGSQNLADAQTLGDYFDNLRGGTASIGVRISANCGDVSTVIFFNDSENSGNLPGGAAATEPDLLFYSPTAISLTTMGIQNLGQSVHPAVLVAVALLAGLTLIALSNRAMVIFNRKRTA
jgi:hypothetical protein